MRVMDASELSFLRVCLCSVRLNTHRSGKVSEYVQTTSPESEDSLAPDALFTRFKISRAGVSGIPAQHEFWNASSRYTPIAAAQKAAQSAKAIFLLSNIKCLTPFRACFIPVLFMGAAVDLRV